MESGTKILKLNDEKFNPKSLKINISNKNNEDIIKFRTDFAMNPTQTFQSSTLSFKFSEIDINHLKRFNEENNVSIYAFLVSAFFVLLYRYTHDANLGVTIYDEKIKNEFPLWISDIKQNLNFIELVKTINQHICGDKLLDNISNIKRAPFGISFTSQERKPTISLNSPSHFFSFHFKENKTLIEGHVEFNTHLFNPTSIKRLISHFCIITKKLLTSFNNSIEDFSFLTEDEIKLFNKANDTIKPLTNTKLIHETISENALKNPNKTALVFHSADGSQKKLTYKEMEDQANLLAAHLQEKGIGPESLVGVSIKRSNELIIAFLAIFKAGGVVVPLDTKSNETLLNKIRNTGMNTVLVDNFTEEFFPKEIIFNVNQLKPCKRTFQKPNLGNNNLAYIIHTSGSTGTPKGVMVEHIGLSNMAQVLLNDLKLSDNAKILCTAPPTFDAFIFEFLDGLVRNGGEVHLLDDSHRLSPQALNDIIKNEKISAVTLLPKVIASLHKEELPSLERVITMGAIPDEKIIQSWMGVIYNGYGPSEATIGTTIQQCQTNKPFTCIGNPFRNYQVMILNGNNECPIGVPGEIVISSIGLARGYFNDVLKTKEKFPSLLFDSQNRTFSEIKNEKSILTNHKKIIRIYRTGDLAVRLEDGSINFLGRIDRQIKINGIRIELDGIVALLNRHPLIENSIVEPTQDKTGIHIWVLLKNKLKSDENAEIIKKYLLANELPIAAKPSIVFIDHIPLNANGKIDVKALPAHTNKVIPNIKAAITEEEKKIHGLWANILAIQSNSFGIDETFEELGGDSLHFASLVIALNENFNLKKRITVFNLISNQTIPDQAKLIVQNLETIKTPLKEVVDQKGPISILQKMKGNEPYFWKNIKRDASPPKSHITSDPNFSLK